MAEIRELVAKAQPERDRTDEAMRLAFDPTCFDRSYLL